MSVTAANTGSAAFSATEAPATAPSIVDDRNHPSGVSDSASSTTRAIHAHKLVNLSIPREDAIEYLEHEIKEWFFDRDIDIDAERNKAEHDSKDPHDIPWYKGGLAGVRIDRAIRYHHHIIRETFRYNPYNLGAVVYAFMMLGQLAFMFGNITIGYCDAKERYLQRDNNGDSMWPMWLALFRGWINSFVILWVFPLFLFPPLIGNAKEQFLAYGLPI